MTLMERSLESFPVIRMAGEDRPRAIQLLGEQHANEAVRKRERGKGEELVGPLLDRGVQAVLPADHEQRVAAGAQPPGDHDRQALRADTLSAPVETEQRRAR